jgi:hypothetical protein
MGQNENITFHRCEWSPPEPVTSVLRWQRVPPIVSLQLASPEDRGVPRRNTARPTRETRTITVHVQSAAAYCPRRGARTACRAGVLACVMSLGVQLKPTATCRGGGCRTRHAHAVRVRLGRVMIWRLRARRGVPWARSSRTAAYASAPCPPTWRATPGWRRMAAAVWPWARGSSLLRLWRSPVWAGRGGSPVWGAC